VKILVSVAVLGLVPVPTPISDTCGSGADHQATGEDASRSPLSCLSRPDELPPVEEKHWPGLREGRHDVYARGRTPPGRTRPAVAQIAQPSVTRVTDRLNCDLD
jgi:hypothetical protein